MENIKTILIKLGELLGTDGIVLISTIFFVITISSIFRFFLKDLRKGKQGRIKFSFLVFITASVINIGFLLVLFSALKNYQILSVLVNSFCLSFLFNIYSDIEFPKISEEEKLNNKADWDEN